MIRRLNLIIILLVVVAQLLLSSCASAPTGAAATVNGEPVPTHYYDVLVVAAQRRTEQVGISINWESSLGVRRLAQIQSDTIKRLVHNSLVEQIAKTRGVTVTDADLDIAMGKVETAFGGTDTVDQKLQQSGLNRDDFRSLYRYFLLDQKLRQADPTGYPSALDQALKDAKVQVYVGPCQQDHDYAHCLGVTGS
jgi:hypothetical protein